MIYKFTQKDLSELALASLSGIASSGDYKALWYVNSMEVEDEAITLELVELVLPER